MSSAAEAPPELPPGANRWLCDFCQEADFEAYHWKVEHERHCERARVTIRIPKLSNKSIGLLFYERASTVLVSETSEVFRYVDEIRAIAGALFSPEYIYGWERLEDSTLNCLVDFGRKYLRQCMKAFEDGIVKGAYLNMIRPGDIVESLKITRRNSHNRGTKKETLCLKEGTGRVRALDFVLSNRDSYPLELVIKRIPILDQTKKSFDPLHQAIRLDLRDNGLVREANWSDFANRLGLFKSLKGLDLEKNGIGRDGCRALASLMREGSALECLSLKHNVIDDECVSIFAEALEHNTTLTYLYLNKNIGITGTGQEKLMNLIGDTPSINETYLSNHTLRGLSWDPKDSDHYDASGVITPLKTLLGINRSRNEYDPARQKVWYVHFGNNLLDLGPFLDMNAAIVPHILAWLTMTHDSEGKRRFRPLFSDEGEHLQHVHRFVRDWNVPALFDFLSPDRSRILELEELVRTLKAKNAKLTRELEAIGEENSNLREELCAFKGNGITPSLKRKRGL